MDDPGYLAALYDEDEPDDPDLYGSSSCSPWTSRFKMRFDWPQGRLQMASPDRCSSK